jgi:F-type H+-transporting ATPase subunit delta
MPNPRLASRYAKSLLDLAVEREQLEPVYSDMLLLNRVIKSSQELRNMLQSPVISSDKKQSVLNAIVGNKIGELTNAFIRLLIAKNRESDLPEIINTFVDQYKEKKGIQIVTLTTAVPATDEVKKAIVDQVRKTSNYKTIELEEKVDPTIIGGFVLQAGDKFIDASVAFELREVSRQFENNDFIYKVR